jgi:hypothetical protein
MMGSIKVLERMEIDPVSQAPKGALPADKHLTPDCVAKARMFTPAIFAILRALKPLNVGDNYYEAYRGHYEKDPDNFFDQYHVAMWYGFKLPPKRILEIGSRTGLSASMLLSGIYDLSLIERVVLLDPWPDGYASAGIVRMNLKRLNLWTDKIELVKSFSQDWCPKAIDKGDEFDYVLVDGDHEREAAARDLALAWPLVAKNGVLVFDDVSADGCDLLPVWDDFIEQLGSDPKAKFTEQRVLSGKGTAWIIKQ